ncbi:hypothetical protein GDO81_026758 [Engystomops pustulosus]|uniref:Secreted protein n=1 Tax=Engystomops pustulosus TaxID=76066 RepID=A0AAV6ZL27_ENGPU|nr:hypothetical protein GDO81_026758 [Engystomops pustulosus]
MLVFSAFPFWFSSLYAQTTSTICTRTLKFSVQVVATWECQPRVQPHIAAISFHLQQKGCG